MKKWCFDICAEERLKALLSLSSPSSEEVLVARHLRKEWQSIGIDTKTDTLGNIYGSLLGTKSIDIGLVAHMDTVSIQITNVLENGMLQFRSLSIHPSVLLGQKISILTSNGYVNGIIGFDPTSQYGQPKGLVLEDLWIDIGCSSKEDSLNYISIGDFASFEFNYAKLGNSNISAASIDNKIGVFVIAECLRWFSLVGAPLNIHAIGTVQEEIGLRGASVISANQTLNACFVVDVDYATDTPTSHNNQLGEVRLGGGVGLHKKADNNCVLRNITVNVANEQNIAHQISLGRYICGGTDSSSLQLGANGIATININIPCRYMHSPIEVCNIADVENAINLLIATVNEIASKDISCYIPEIN